MLNSFASLTVCVTWGAGVGGWGIARSVFEFKTFRILRVCENAASGATELTYNNLNLLNYRSGSTARTISEGQRVLAVFTSGPGRLII